MTCNSRHPLSLRHPASSVWSFISKCVRWCRVDSASFVSVTWPIGMCNMTHSNAWRDSFICETWLIRMCDMTSAYAWHGAFIWVIWLMYMCDMIHVYVWDDSCICVTWLIHMCVISCSLSCLHFQRLDFIYVCHNTYKPTYVGPYLIYTHDHKSDIHTWP